MVTILTEIFDRYNCFVLVFPDYIFQKVPKIYFKMPYYSFDGQIESITSNEAYCIL